MAITVNTNIPSFNAQRNLANVTSLLQKSLERLSSGLRINRAADDAAGLAISEGIRSQVRGLTQAIRNANDGISVLSTAEGALAESVNIIQRVRELAVQAASDTNSATNRASIQAEINQQLSELSRMANTVEFNGLKLLDGTFTNKQIQVGAFQNQTIKFSISDARATALGKVASLVSGNVTSDLTEGDLKLNNVSVGATVNDGVSYLVADESALAIVNAINNVAAETGVSAEVNATQIVVNGSFGTAPAAPALNAVMSGFDAAATSTVVVTTSNNGILVTVGGTTTGVALADGDTLANLVAKINAASTGATASLMMDSGGKYELVLVADDPSKTVTVANGAVAPVWASGPEWDVTNADIASDDDIAATTSTIASAAGSLILAAEDGTAYTFAVDATTTLAQLATAINAQSGTTKVAASIVAEAGGTFELLLTATTDGKAINISRNDTDLTLPMQYNNAVKAINLDGDEASGSALVINGINIGSVVVEDGDASNALIDAINDRTTQTGVTASINSSNQLVLSAEDGRNITVKTTGAAGANLGFVYGRLDSTSANLAGTSSDGTVRGTFTLYSNKAFSISGNNVANAGLTAQSVAVDASTSLVSVDVTTSAGAASAIRTIDFALDQLSKNRSDLGAVTNRLESMIRNLNAISENLQASDSRIRDVDFALETANSTKYQILQQTSLAILAQANVQPQAALSLLG